MAALAHAHVESEIEPHRLADAAAALRFMLGGNATVTLRSKASGTRFTYRLQLGEREGAPTFVGLLTGPDNESSYQYLGHIFPGAPYQHGRKSKVAADAPGAKAFAWAWSYIQRGELPEALEVWHEARCGRCGRKLTVPASIESGFGPECVKRVD